MPALSTQEHQRVQRESKDRRNAGARRQRMSHKEAVAWCQTMGATVRAYPYQGRTLYEVRVPRFQPASALSLAHAVAALDANITTFINSRATHGPTGARLDRLREARRSLNLQEARSAGEPGRNWALPAGQ